MCVDKNRIFDIDLLFVSPELQAQDSATFRGGKLRIARELLYSKYE